MKDALYGCLAAVVCFVIALIFGPILIFVCGYITGMILRLTVGVALTNGLNVLFNTTRFTPDFLPIVCGGLAVVGSFFRNTNTSSSKKD